MIRYRSFRNTDAPAIADLWSRAAPARNAVRPLTVHEFDALVFGKLGFEAEGLIIAEDESRMRGFAHAGFGPLEPRGPSHRLDSSMGTIAMLLAEAGEHQEECCDGLVREACAYLRRRGAQVIYAGGRAPVAPFYWGIYGGTEFGGILESHRVFRQAAERAGFQATATAVLFEAPLSEPEPRDVRFAPVRRQFRVDVQEDALLDRWWDALAIGQYHPTRLQLVDRQTAIPRASAWTWEIAPGFAAEDGLSRTALIDLEVHADFRRRGLGRTLVVECFRHAREQHGDLLCVQADSENVTAVRLYQSLGFEMIEHATLYRLPAGMGA